MMATIPNELPANFAFPEELPANFFAAQPGDLSEGVAYPPDVVPADQAPPLSWWEAAFPRSVAAADRPAYDPRALAAAGLDVASLPGRAYESLFRPDGESYTDAVARLTGRQDEGGAKRFTAGLLRDPANLPIAAAVAAAPYAIPALIGGAARMAPGAAQALRPMVAAGMVAQEAASPAVQAIGRGAVTGAGIGSTLATTRQAENVAAGYPLSAGQVGIDVGLGSILGAGMSSLAPLGRRMVAGSKEALQQIIKPQGLQEIQDFERALEAGLLPQFAGYGTITAKGAGKRYLDRLGRQSAGYNDLVAAADATGQLVNASEVMRSAERDVAGRIATGGTVLDPQAAGRGLDWAGRLFAAPGDAGDVSALMRGVGKIPPKGPTVAIGAERVIRPEMAMPGPVFMPTAEQVATQSPKQFQDVMVGGVRRRLELPPVPAEAPQISFGPNAQRLGSGEVTPAVSMTQPTGKYRQLVPGETPVVPDVTILPSVAQRRKSALWDEAFKSLDADQTARGASALAAGRAANAELARISPELAAMNRQIAPWYAGADAANRALLRGNNYALGPMELWAGAAGGGLGLSASPTAGATGVLGSMLAARAMRSPAAVRALHDVGQVMARRAQRPGLVGLGLGLRGSQTDNARER
jgi:hypothetical protein